jgi:hypothetical protein
MQGMEPWKLWQLWHGETTGMSNLYQALAVTLGQQLVIVLLISAIQLRVFLGERHSQH